MRRKTLFCSISAVAALPLALQPGVAGAQQFTAWRLATVVAEVNSPVADGCPIESRDGLSLYIASVRTGTLGGNDIWASDRATKASAWSEPQNLGGPVNTAAADFCPTPVDGSYLYFVSERPGAETCGAGPGLGDIYVVRRNAAFGFGEPKHLGCIENGTGPNSAAAEFSPSLVKTSEGTFLYFSSTIGGNHDLYVSQMGPDGEFGAPTNIAELNTASDDRMPNVSRDNLEIVFSSTRATDANGTPSLGSFDVFTSSRPDTSSPWSTPVNLGPNVNTAGSETRSTISWDRKRLYFGRDGEIYSSKRKRVVAP